MADPDSETSHIQASFVTKQEEFAIPETPFSIPVTATRDELTTLINQCLLDSAGERGGVKSREFDFLINGELIRETLESYITERNISVENVIEVEYVERNPPPSLSEEMDHRDWVSCVHCNGRFILTGCYDGNVRIWNPNGQVNYIFDPSPSPAQQKHRGRLLCVVDAHSAPVKDVHWVTTDDPSVEEHLFLSASQDQHINVYRFTPATSEVVHLHQCKGHARSVEAITVSRDKSKFCSVSWDKLLKVWSAVPDTTQVDEVETDTDLPPKRKRVSTQTHRTTTRTPLLTLSGHNHPVTGVAWVGEEEVVSAGWDHCIRVWDVSSGVNTATLTGSSKVFHDIDHSPLNQLVASACSDRHVRIWDTRQTERSVVQSTLSSHQGWVVAVHWSPESEHQLLSGSYDSTVRMWDIRSNKTPLFTIAAHERKVLCLDWSLPKVFASGGTDNKLRTYTV